LFQIPGVANTGGEQDHDARVKIFYIFTIMPGVQGIDTGAAEVSVIEAEG
jgi:hypothetical protein